MAAKLSARRRLVPGKASDYIAHGVESGDVVLVVCRVSSGPQETRGNLKEQAANLRAEAEAAGASVVGVWKHVGSGTDPEWLAGAIAKAWRLGATKVLAESTDRLIRHPGYHSRDFPDAQARKPDLENLARNTDGFPLATDLAPDAPPAEVRAYQRRRGQAGKGNRGGRPCSYRKRSQYKLRQVLELRKAGTSWNVIATQTGVPKSTARYWCKTYAKGGAKSHA